MEVQDQGVGRHFPEFSLLDMLVATVSSHGPLSMYPHPWDLFLFLQEHSHFESELLMASFYLSYFFKGPFIL